MLTPQNNSPGAEAISGKPHAGIIGNEGGFILAFSMFMLAVCMIIGMAAMNTGVTETDISANEVVVKQVYELANSGYPLAAIPILTTGGVGTWNNGVYLKNTNPLETVTSGGAIQILDGQFLYEGREEDPIHATGWNNSEKYLSAKLGGLGSSYETLYKPVDDPFQARKVNGQLYDTSIDNTSDIRIRYDQLVIDVDVDKAAVAFGAGGVAEFGSGADGSGGTAYKIIYLMDCKATVIGKSITDSKAPVTEILLGYRFIPGAGI